jgi:hypothetical protein
MRMNSYLSLTNRFASIVIGITLCVVSAIFAALGVTLLPVIGILLAVPVMSLAIFFLNTKMERRDLPKEEDTVLAEGTWHLTDALSH